MTTNNAAMASVIEALPMPPQSPSPKSNWRVRAFLIVAALLLGLPVLFAFVMVPYNAYARLGEAQRKSVKLDLSALSNGVDRYRAETGRWPDSLTQLAPKFIYEVHTDPWGSDYVFVRSGEGYDVFSYGVDKARGGGDDILVHGGEISVDGQPLTPVRPTGLPVKDSQQIHNERHSP